MARSHTTDALHVGAALRLRLTTPTGSESVAVTRMHPSKGFLHRRRSGCCPREKGGSMKRWSIVMAASIVAVAGTLVAGGAVGAKVQGPNRRITFARLTNFGG